MDGEDKKRLWGWSEETKTRGGRKERKEGGTRRQNNQVKSEAEEWGGEDEKRELKRLKASRLYLSSLAGVGALPSSLQRN